MVDERDDEPTMQMTVERGGQRIDDLEARLSQIRQKYPGYFFSYLVLPRSERLTKVETIVNKAGDEMYVHLEENDDKISAYKICPEFRAVGGTYSSIRYSHFANDTTEESLMVLESNDARRNVIMGHTIRSSQDGEKPVESYQLKTGNKPVDEYTREGIQMFRGLSEGIIDMFLVIEEYLKENIPLYFRYTTYQGLEK